MDDPRSSTRKSVICGVVDETPMPEMNKAMNAARRKGVPSSVRHGEGGASSASVGLGTEVLRRRPSTGSSRRDTLGPPSSACRRDDRSNVHTETIENNRVRLKHSSRGKPGGPTCRSWKILVGPGVAARVGGRACCP